MQRIELNGSKVYVLPVIKGLVSEGEKVRAAILETRPEAVGVSISREELEGLRSYQGEEIGLSALEEAYKAGLEEFGEVQLPPPCYLEALRACEELGIPLIPLDMIFIKADGSIDRIAENAVPQSEEPIASGGEVVAVLELAGGSAARLGIDESAHVSWTGGPH